MEISLRKEIELYDWQKDCLSVWEENGRHGIVHVITGAGKTVFALAAADSLRDMPCHIRIVVPTVSLMYQWKKAIMETVSFQWEEPEKPVGLFCGEVKDRSPAKFTVYVVNSARHAISGHILRDMKKGISTLLILDECHHYGTPENAKIFHFRLSPDFRKDLYMSLGLSATPFCTGYEEVLLPAVGKEIFRYDLSHAGKDNRIPNCFIFQVALSFREKELCEYTRITDAMDRLFGILSKRYAFLPEASLKERIRFLREAGEEGKGDQEAWTYLCLMYERTKLTVSAGTRVEAAEKILKLLGQQKKVLIFSERIDQAEKLYRKLSRTMSSQVGIYHSKMTRDARKLALERFRDGETRILVSCKALDEGTDVPAADAGIILSGTGVERQRIQRFGRLLRKKEGKDAAILYYLYISQSQEESRFLPDLPCPENIVNMTYLHKEKLFICVSYEELAYPFLEKYRKNDPLYKEYRRCLTRGEDRPDWLLPPETLERKMEAAADTRERNYYYVMKSLSCLRLERQVSSEAARSGTSSEKSPVSRSESAAASACPY